MNESFILTLMIAEIVNDSEACRAGLEICKDVIIDRYNLDDEVATDIITEVSAALSASIAIALADTDSDKSILNGIMMEMFNEG